MILRLLLASMLVFAAFNAHAADVQIGELVLPAPDAWKVEKGEDANTIRLHPAKGSDFYIEVTALPEGQDKDVGMELVHSLVEANAEKMKDQSVEKELALQELKSATAQGYYFFATDPAPKPGEWTYMTSGLMLVGKLPVSFTVLSNGKASPPEQAMDMLRAAHLK